MKTIVMIILDIVVVLARLSRPGGAKTIIAENMLLRHQNRIAMRGKKRSPKLSTMDRIILAIGSLYINLKRIRRVAFVVKPQTILNFHRALVKRKYRHLFSSSRPSKPGPKGPSQDLIDTVLDIKRKNPTYGCPKIADIVTNIFGVDIDDGVVRRVLEKYYKPDPDYGGPSWLSFLGLAKDSLWSMDLFCCESAFLQTYWVLVIMDQYSRKIIGFAVNERAVTGERLREMFLEISSGNTSPKRLSHDHDPLFYSYAWRSLADVANHFGSMEEIWSVPKAPVSHPFIERLVGTVRRDFLDRTLFTNGRDLKNKLMLFQMYYNTARVHRSLCGQFPAQWGKELSVTKADLKNYRWKSYCRGLHKTPVAA